VVRRRECSDRAPQAARWSTGKTLVEFKKGLAGRPPEGPADARYPGKDPTPTLGESGVFFYTVEEGQRVLMRRPDGTMQVLVGPRRVWRGRNVFAPMDNYVATPVEFLILRNRDGRQEPLAGSADVWLDPRVHQSVVRQDGLQLAAKEAVVVYSRPDGADTTSRRIVYGPGLFIPQPGE